MNHLRPGKELLSITVSKAHPYSHLTLLKLGCILINTIQQLEVNGDGFTLTYQTSLNEFSGAEWILDIP